MTAAGLTGLGGAAVRSVLFCHAHPDDETLATGALIARLVADGVRCDLLTATRGEQGEVVPGSSTATQGSAELESVRRKELAGAVATLGLASQTFLGESPARAADLPARRYRDSGMQWIRPGLAGPSDAADETSFTAAPVAEAVADLAELVRELRPDLVVSYAADGGYGHPDHVRLHEVALAAARETGTRFAEIVPEPDPGDPTILWFELREELPVVQRALRSHATQLTVDDTEVVHVGGQREPIATSVGLRLR